MDNQFSTKQFTYKDFRFTAEASDLGLKSTPKMIFLQSAKTGRVEGFKLTHIDRDVEGEVTGWVYTNPTGLSVLIIND